MARFIVWLIGMVLACWGLRAILDNYVAWGWSALTLAGVLLCGSAFAGFAVGYWRSRTK